MSKHSPIELSVKLEENLNIINVNLLGDRIECLAHVLDVLKRPMEKGHGLCYSITRNSSPSHRLSKAYLAASFMWFNTKSPCVTYPVLGGEDAFDRYTIGWRNQGEPTCSHHEHWNSRHDLKDFLITTFTKQLSILNAL